MRRRSVKKSYSQQGFSLVELAIVMIISGFLFTVVVNAYSMRLQGDDQELLLDNARELQGALFEFLANTGRYPCPADPTLAPGDALYGRENCAFNIITSTSDVDGVPGFDRILTGSFPFEDMIPVLFGSPLSGQHTVDPWGNKFTYVVSESLTQVATYNDFYGVIDVVDEYGNTILQPAKTIHALVLSHGKDGRNAYSLDGTLVDPIPILPCVSPPAPVCPPPPPPPGTISVNQIENANNDETFLAGLINESNANYNDDYTFFVNNKTSNLWPIVGNNGNPVNTIFYVQNANPGNVGVGIQDPVEKLDINGNILANAIQGQQVCDTGGLNCMPISRLAGNDPQMQCPPGQAMTGVANNASICAPVFASPSNITCPPGEVINGFSNLGNVNCIIP